MFNVGDLPETLALFPLPRALLLPRTRLPLHIFEPRYLAMLDDTLKTPARLIGMIQPLSAPKNPDALHAIGCAGRVTAYSETEDGRYMITLTGISRFRIKQEFQGFTPYRRGEVVWDGYGGDRDHAEADGDFQRQVFLTLLRKYLIAADLKTDWDSLKQAEDELLINSLSMLCPFEIEEKQALLEADDLSGRRRILVTLMEYTLRGGAAEEVMQ